MSDFNEPSWLSKANDAPASPAKAKLASKPETPTRPDSAASAPANAATDVSAISKEEAEQEQLRGVILFSRLLNLGVSAGLITMAIMKLIGIRSPKTIVLACYALLGGCLIGCLETQLKMVRTTIAVNFGFLFNAPLRLIFYFIVASICLSFKGDVFGMIMAGVTAATAIWNCYVILKYPAYRQMRDNLAKEEDARIEAKIREEMRKKATIAMFSKN